MKKIVLLVVVIFFFSCQEEVSKTDVEIKKAISNVVNEWHLFASKADFVPYMNQMADNAIFVGTDAKEHWTKEQFAKFSKPYFDKGKAWSFTPLQRNIFLSQTKNIAWFDELLDTWMGVCRGSGVLEKTPKGWKIKHYVLSVTVPNEDMGKVIKVKKEKDSLTIRSYK